MLQAIVVKNPKWEPFTKASDAFKATTVKEGETAILVVRGRCKEKTMKNSKSLKSGKTAEWIKTQSKAVADKLAKASAVVACFLFIGLTANAQQDLLPKLPATYIAGLTTNSTPGAGVVGWNIDQIGVFQLTITGTNAGAATLLKVWMDSSDTGTYWSTNTYSVTATPVGVGTATSITKLTNTVGAKYIRFGRIDNTNAATGGLTINAFSASFKEN